MAAFSNIFKRKKARSSSDERSVSVPVTIESLTALVASIRPFLLKVTPQVVADGQRVKLFVETHVLPYYTEALGLFLWNLALIFLGGQFALTIMAIQSFNMVDSGRIRASIDELRESYKDAIHKLREDPEARLVLRGNDVSPGGVVYTVVMLYLSDSADDRKNAHHLASICMRCVDPHKLSSATNGIILGLVAIIATLRSNIAKCISVGAMIGNHVADFARRRAQKPLYVKYPEHKDWVDVGLQSASSLVGFIISLLLVRVVNAFNSAVKGAEGLVRQILDYLHKKGYCLHVRQEDALVQSASIALVFIGVMLQIKLRFTCPWYLKVPMLPVLIVEYLLSVLSVI